MKLLVETPGDFMLMIPGTSKEIAWHRPTVVANASYIQAMVSIEALCVICELPDDASDEAFVGFLKASDGDAELAIASYRATFQADAEVELAPVLRSKKNRGR